MEGRAAAIPRISAGVRRWRRTRRFALAFLAVAAGALSVALIVQNGQHSTTEAAVSSVLAVIVGWSYIASGLVAWEQARDGRLGPLMVFIGFAWFATFLAESEQSFWFTAGTAVEDLYLAGFVYLVFSFPSGRITRRLDRALVATAFALCTVVELAYLLFADSSALICDGCPANALEITRSDTLATVIVQGQRIAGLALCLVTVALFVGRARRASAPQRRAAAPVLWTGGAMFAALALSIGNDVAGEPLGALPDATRAVVFGAIPVAILAVLLQRRLARGAVADLVVEMGAGTAPVDLREALSRALGDPSLKVAYWIPASGAFVDGDGNPFALPANDADVATTAVERDGQPIAVLVHDAALRDDPELIDSVCAAAALTLENERLRAELLARLAELKASRARLLEATESERRRIERDLHDGAQQRLISIAMTLGLAESRLARDPGSVAPVLQEARRDLTQAIDELRELSQGIRPAILVERGLAGALDDLARRSTVPARLSVELSSPVPEQAQAAAYFVASEALANAAKHAHATRVSIVAVSDAETVSVSIEDDGIGGADASFGTGLRGLADRVEGLGGSLTVSSPIGHGTRVRAELPCG